MIRGVSLLPARSFATHAPRSSRLGKALSLDHVGVSLDVPKVRCRSNSNIASFLQRGRVLAFYRTVLRGTRRIGDISTRLETRRFARDEFERHRHVTDISHIRYLLSTGKTEWDTMERYIDGM